MSLKQRISAVLLVTLVSTMPSSWAQDADEWLERMTRAAQRLNYDGTFVYRNGSQMESMRIIHRADDTGERSRLIALSGVKREVLRDHTQVVCILPDDESVVVAKTRPPNPFFNAILTATARFSSYYDMSVSGGDRVAGRSTEVVMLAPRDEYRYGYNLWVDRETGLLLKSDLIDGGGEILEQFIFTSIELPEQIADELLQPGITGQSLTWHISDAMTAVDRPGEASTERPHWSVGWLPVGFMMADCSRSDEQDGKAAVTQMVYTDGLASLSVFVERLGQSEPLQGLSAMGAMNAFGHVIDGHQVTVVGEVPASTVKAVALSVTHAE